jgi:WD40 repeat protein
VPGTQCEVAISIDMNNDVGIWSLSSGFRQKAFWSAKVRFLTPQVRVINWTKLTIFILNFKGVPPLSSTPHNGYSATSMVFSPSGGVLFTGGSDMRIRGWNLAEAKKSRMIVNSASSQSEGHRYDVTYSERKLEGIELIEENRDNIVQVALEESDWGLMGPPPGHWDVVSSLQYISKVNYLIVP